MMVDIVRKLSLLLYDQWWWCSSLISSNLDSLIWYRLSLLPSRSTALRVWKVSAVTSPNTTFLRSRKGHGAKVIKNRLLQVFY
jgi:hypothetical protein